MERGIGFYETTEFTEGTETEQQFSVNSVSSVVYCELYSDEIKAQRVVIGQLIIIITLVLY